VAITIEDPEVDSLARELAANTGETVEQAIVTAVKERLARQKKTQHVRDAVREFRESVRGLHVADQRSADEILGYDDSGLPH
jgi:antitoxin VapB